VKLLQVRIVKNNHPETTFAQKKSPDMNLLMPGDCADNLTIRIYFFSTKSRTSLRGTVAYPMQVSAAP
jgi:hypothetical protein